jgi:hypothetical protein
MSNGSKKCSKCGQIKSLDEFYRCSRVKDGRQAACKECKKESRKAYLSNRARGGTQALSREHRVGPPRQSRGKTQAAQEGPGG